MKKLTLFLAFILTTSIAHAINIPKGFQKETVQLPGVKLNVYKGGSGEPLVLLHGYAESALMWHQAMERFSDHYTVIVPDLRGSGLSEVTKQGYTKVEMAADIKNLLDHYKISKANIVGHDIGLMVAYAFAAKYPESTIKLAVLDAFIPGVGPGDDIYNSPDIWHFRFHGKVPEQLVKGHEKLYFDSLWSGFSADPKTFPNAKKDYFAKQYAAEGHMRAGFEWFKALPQDAKDNKVLAKNKLQMPVLSVGGEKSMGQALADTVKLVAPHAKTIVLPNTGHWLLEENPKATLQALEDFLKAETLK